MEKRKNEWIKPNAEGSHGMESGCSCSIGGIKDRVHLNLRKKQIFLSGGR